MESVTRVCLHCGYLVLDGPRCRRDDSVAIEWKLAAKACRVRTLRELLHLEPGERLRLFDAARAALRARLAEAAA